jgi:alkaline phosphatase D
MTLTRRAFLRSATATAALAGAGLPGCAGPSAGMFRPQTGLVFRHGVASGDPLADRVILWTHVAAPGLLEPVPVSWVLATDPDLREVVASGRLSTGPERDHTVKLDPVGLEPGRTYYYRFEARGERSPVGRTRTLPVGGIDRLRLAFCSCANYPQGFFHAYAGIARRADLDAVLHLGDYLYEYGESGSAPGRGVEPYHEIVSLADYRTRHALYKRDPDLQEAHRQHPFIAIWDDHESANNSWFGGAANHDPGRGEGDWAARKAAAIRAYFEWMPIRALPGEPALARRGRIYRGFRFGELADLLMLDTRLLARDEPAARGDLVRIDDPERSLLGSAQEAWLLDQLSASKREGVSWRLLGQQVIFSPFTEPGRPVNSDAWDGYRPSRQRILDHLGGGRIDDVVILTGDMHSSWAFDVSADPFSAGRYDPATGRGSLAVELVTPAVSASPLASFPGVRERFARVLDTHPHCHFVDLERHGYVLLDVDHERVQAEWHLLEGVTEPEPREYLARALLTRRGANHLEPAPAASRPRTDAPAPAPTT